jgi:hypothetical protein
MRDNVRTIVTTSELDVTTVLFDMHVWESLFPWETPTEVVSKVVGDHDVDVVTAEVLAVAVWHEMFDDGERVTFCDMIADDVEERVDVDDAAVLQSLARTLHWVGGVRSIFEE